MYITALGTELKMSGAPNSWISSTAAKETLIGTPKNDVFHEVGGDSSLGGAGDDHYYWWDSSATATEAPNEGVDTVYANFWGRATLPANIENLILGSNGSTIGIGNDLDNIIMAGPVGATLNGAGGNDVLVGGVGNDVFEIVKGNGSDAIMSFTPGQDIIHLENYGFASFSEVMAHAAQTGPDVTLSLTGGETLVIRDVQISALSGLDIRLSNDVSTPIPASVFDTIAPTPGISQLKGPGAAYTAQGWYVLNNVWNPGQLVSGRDYRISSTYSKADLTGGTTFNWSFPDVDMSGPTIVRAYPEVIFGPAPMSGGAKPTDIAGVFPVKVDDIKSLAADYDVSFHGDTKGFNVSYDIWLTNTPNGGTNSVTNEIMVWLHQGDVASFGTRVGTYVDGAFSAIIYHSASKNYTAIVSNSDSTTGILDIAKVLHTLGDLGIVSNNEYLGSVELGAEVVSGAGSLSINNLDLKLVTAANGIQTTKLVTGAGTTVTTQPIETLAGQHPAAVPSPSVAADPLSYSDFYHHYSVALSGGTGTIASAEHTDRLASVGTIHFLDGTLTFDSNSHAAEVMRLYDAVLNRSPDAYGLDGWVAALDAGTSLKTVAAGFVHSPEFNDASNALDNAAFVDYLYNHALGRAADPAGRNYWINALDHGADRVDLVVSFSESEEHQAATATDLARGLFVPDDAFASVFGLYDTFADRAPDINGAIYWTTLLKDDKLTLPEIAKAFVASDEFQTEIAGLSHAGIVDLLYRNALDRAAEPDGKAFWVNALDHGTPLSDVLLGFNNSTEHQAMIATQIGDGWHLI